MACVFTLFMVNHYSASMLFGDPSEKVIRTYMPTHTRYGAWVIGVLLGYIMHHTKIKRVSIPNV